MSAWLNAMNPTAPITSEAEAQKAARSSAVSIFIGVVAGIVGIIWSFMIADELAAAAAAGAQAGIWLGVGLTVVQLVFALIQWRDPKKFIAWLFLALIALGFVGTLATPLMADAVAAAGVPPTPMWQIVLSLVTLVIQAVLHVAGLRGMKRLDDIQMSAAR
ncbi:hypothetical protein ACO2Q1_15585 [Brevundimonas sp. VNH65]|uniref:hypothetical protein n=1 Tax=Brevundimonas sp. VNH65 TaxID=3400917 RepID=UPI003C0FC625